MNAIQGHLSYRILRTGSCRSLEKAILPKTGRMAKVDIPALITLLEHPDEGPILYDAGYSSSMFPHARTHWSSRLYMKLVPVTIPTEEDAIHQLRELGWNAEDISLMILSHFHPDHIGGVRDFPRSRFLCLREAWETIRDRSGFSAARRGFFPDLLPEDFRRRLTLMDPDASPLEGYEAFGRAVDLLGDQSLWGISLPGHAAGQMGLAFRDDKGTEVFLCADACWYRTSFRESQLPSPLTYWLLEQRSAFEATFSAICALHRERPEVEIIPAHCPEGLFATPPSEP